MNYPKRGIMPHGKERKLEKGLSNTGKKKPSAEVKDGKITFSPDPATALVYLCVLLDSRDLMPSVLEVAEDEEDAKDLLNAAGVAVGSIAEQILQAREKAAKKGDESAKAAKRPVAKA
jgi:hypothetical protein